MISLLVAELLNPLLQTPPTLGNPLTIIAVGVFRRRQMSVFSRARNMEDAARGFHHRYFPLHLICTKLFNFIFN
jgi:hypothetical protein